jgi:hypothetical protein
MARAHGRISVKDKPGNAIQNALVELFLEGTTTPVTDAWSAKTGGTLTPTVLTNSGGIAEFWLDTAKTITARISSNSNQAFYAGSSDKANLATQSVTVEVHPNPEDIAGGGGGSTPDATSSVKGKLQLAGDLGGTATSPTVPSLATKATDSLVVHLAGSETITGDKTYTGKVMFANGVPFASVRGFAGADPTGATSSQTAYNSAKTALAAYGGGILWWGPGIWALDNAAWTPSPNIIEVGVGDATIIRPVASATTRLLYAFNDNWEIRDLTIDCRAVVVPNEVIVSTNFKIRNVKFYMGGSYGLLVTISTHGKVIDCEFWGKANSNDSGVASQIGLGCRNIKYYRPKFRNCAAGVSGAGGGATNFDTQVSDDVVVDGADYDGMWFSRPARITGSGGTVSYTATVLTDTGAAFSGIAANTTLRIMPVRATGTATSVNNTQVTHSAATFQTSLVTRGDRVVFGTVYGLVLNVESQTVLGVEEWLNVADNTPAAEPAAGTYTIYRTLLATVLSNTGTTVTVARIQDLTGLVVLPAAGTRYEVLYDPTSHPFTFEAGFLNGKVLNSTVKRGWGDQIRTLGKFWVIANNYVEDGFDVGIEAESGGNSLIVDNIIRGQGVWGIMANDDSTIVNNIVMDTPYLNPATGAPIVALGSRVHVVDNHILRGRIAASMYQWGVLVDGVAAIADNILGPNTITGAPSQGLYAFLPSGGNISRTSLSIPTNVDATPDTYIIPGQPFAVLGTVINSFLVRSITDVDVVNTTTETSIGSVTIPAKITGIARQVEVIIDADYLNNAALGSQNFTIRIKLGGTTIYDGGLSPNITVLATRRAVRWTFQLIPQASSAAQEGFGNFQYNAGTATVGVGALNAGGPIAVNFRSADSTKDMTVDQVLDFTVQHVSADPLISFRRRNFFARLV